MGCFSCEGWLGPLFRSKSYFGTHMKIVKNLRLEEYFLSLGEVWPPFFYLVVNTDVLQMVGLFQVLHLKIYIRTNGSVQSVHTTTPSTLEIFDGYSFNKKNSFD